jgi:hypothetical protein
MAVQCLWILLLDDNTMQRYAVLSTLHTEYEERKYLRNVSDIDYIHTVSSSSNRMYIKTEERRFLRARHLFVNLS